MHGQRKSGVEQMSRAQNWIRWSAALGAALFLGGVAWISVLIYRIRDLPEEIKYEVRMPWTPRLMVFVGLALLASVAIRVGIDYLRSRKLTGSGH